MKAELWSSLRPLMKLPHGSSHDWTTSTFCDGRTVEKTDWQQVACITTAARMHVACVRQGRPRNRYSAARAALVTPSGPISASLLMSSKAANRMRARFTRLLTVPSGTLQTSAASS